jgi:hypothetical protein
MLGVDVGVLVKFWVGVLMNVCVGVVVGGPPASHGGVRQVSVRL